MALLGILQSSAKMIFAASITFKPIKTGSEVIETSSPLTTFKNVTFTILKCCTSLSPSIKIAVKCAALAGNIASSVVSLNSITLGCSVSLVCDIFEECI